MQRKREIHNKRINEILIQIEEINKQNRRNKRNNDETKNRHAQSNKRKIKLINLLM